MVGKEDWRGGRQIIQGRQIQAGAFLPACAALAVFSLLGFRQAMEVTTVKRVCCYPAHLTGRLEDDVRELVWKANTQHCHISLERLR